MGPSELSDGSVCFNGIQMNSTLRWIKRCLGKRHNQNRQTGSDSKLRSETLEPRNMLAAAPVITEFMASNSDTLLDGNGSSSDWIEIFNSGDSVADLSGWYLTDDAGDLTKWSFPAETLLPGDFLVVFASGNDTPDGAGNLHTNFRLSSGEYLALVSPDRSIVSEYFPDGDYPPQVSDVSFGAGQSAFEIPLVDGNSTARFHVPSDNSLGESWTEVGFLDANWQSGKTPVGFDAGVQEAMENGDGEVVLQIDFNDRSAPTQTQDGYEGFLIDSSGMPTLPVTRSMGAFSVTLSETSGLGFDDKRNILPLNTGGFTQSNTHRDFIYSLDDSGSGGLDVTIDGLVPGQTYTTNLWSFDFSASGDRVSDWTVNGVSAADNYTFTGSQIPSSDNQFQITAVISANAQGQLQIQGRRDATSVSYGVYLNAIQVIQGEVAPEPPPGTEVPISPVLKIDMNDGSDGESGAANTEVGYQSFTLESNGASYDGITVTMTAIGGATLDDRDRTSPTDSGNFDLDQIYDDFIFANGTTNGAGAEIRIQGLAANTEYQVKLRSYDVSSTGSRRSVWTEMSGTEPVVFANPYTFDGANPPDDNDDNSIVAMLTTSSDGELLLRGERQGGTSHGVFVNALELGLPGFGSLIETDLQSQLYEQATSAFVRIPFEVPADIGIDLVSLEVAYDAGFVAYLNGSEIARRNVDGANAPNFDDAATTERGVVQTVTPSTINVSSFAGQLNTGPNVLAFHVLNSDINDGNLFFSPELSLTSIQSGAPLYFDQPTPGAPNQGGFAGFVGDTSFSRSRGFYEVPFSLEITSSTPGAEIYYTTDGSIPSESNGALYAGAISIAETTILRAIATQPGFRPSNVDSQTYLFLEDVLAQDPQADPDAPNYPNTWQAGVSGDYAIDPEVVADWDDNNPANEDFGIREALKSIPTLSLVMDHDDLWGSSNGIYPDATRRIRRPGSVEYFDPNTGEQFQYNVGVQMHGNASRDNVRLLKHSFRLIFSRAYDGPGRLNFPIFDDSDFSDINTLILRASFTDAFATRTATNRYSPMDSTYTRDVWMRESQIAMGSLSADSTYVHLYINGLYWGMYNPSEKADAAFYAAHEGGEPEDWDVLKDFDELDSGERTAWNEMFALAGELRTAEDPDAIYWQLRGMNPDGSDNAALPNYLDMENLIDYMIVHYTTGPEDWPHHNWHAGRNRVNPGKGFQFQVWDQEIVLDGRFRDTTEAADKGPAQLHDRLRNSPEYRQHFGDRVQRHLFNGGVLTVEANQERWMAIADQVEAAIIGESARWGDAREGQRITVSSGQPVVTVPTLTVDHWRETIADVHDRQFEIYHESSIEWLQEDGLYPLANTPVFNQYGGEVSTGFQVTMDSPPATVMEEVVIHSEGDDILAFLPTDDSLETGAGPHWFDTDFEPTDWITGPSGVGFGDSPTSLRNAIGTNVLDQWNANPSSIYTRIEFTLDETFDASAVEEFSTRLKYDDGFVIYLNGQRVLSDRAPDPSGWDTDATGTRISILSGIAFRFDLTEHASLLQAGENVLAIQALNITDTDADMLIAPQVTLIRNVALDSPPIYFTTNGEDPRLLGGEINPIAQLYSGPLTVDESTEIRARAIINNQWSAIADPTFVVSPAGSGIVVSEINYNPYDPTVSEQAAIPDVNNDDFEFLELLNTNQTEAVNLLGMEFIDGIEFRFGDATLAPNERAVLVRNSGAFGERYGSDIRVLGEYQGGLANGGERLIFVDAVGDTVTNVEYGGELWPESADGVGASLELIDPAAITVALTSKPYAYRGSTNFGGSPGTAGGSPVGVVINEVLSHSAAVGTVDAIELLNTTTGNVDISGWWLSDARGTLNKFVIPAGTVLQAGEYIVFDESQFNPSPLSPLPNHFALDSSGDDVWLVKPIGEDIDSFVDNVSFGGAADGVSFLRLPDGRMVPQSSTTFGCENLHPQLSTLVISEVNYNPGEPSEAAKGVYQAIAEDDLEFVELFNPTADSMSLADWRLRGGVDYTFPGATLASGEALIVVSFNPDDPDNADRADAFRTHYGIGDNVRMVGGWGGQLSDSGEAVRLRRPVVTPDAPLYAYEDGISYDDRSQWPISADGGGNTLQRRVAVYAGSASTSWTAAPPTPGQYTADPEVMADLTGDTVVDGRDIDVLRDIVRRGITSYGDLDKNGSVNDDDVNFLIRDVIGTELGDANLDGFVDGSDFNIWNDNKFESCAKSWSHGDFNGDQVVDATDFNFWTARRFTGDGLAGQQAQQARVPQAAAALEAVDFEAQNSKRRDWILRRASRWDDASSIDTVLSQW